ncbi:MAG: hypothetical protein ATN36_07110 [Epulopiscium sp. Nele67-Bin005]|nr:MAG: hypothetical protein ATN36_07110 [Epulopiscium sp. Nele67-Bin005]
MKIDCHMHITPPDIINNPNAKFLENETYFKWLSASKINKFATGNDIIDELNNANFDKGVVFGFGFKDPSLCKYVNDYTIEQIQKYPDKLIGFMVIQPNDPHMATEIERCANAGLVGIGELFPEGQNFDLTKIHSTSQLNECCSKFNLPILLHTNENIGHNYVGKTKTTLQELEIFIKNHTHTPIILAHMGGGLLFFECMKEIHKLCENVYYDTAALLFLYEATIYQIAKQLNIEHKILFGSDYPLVQINKYDKGFADSRLDDKIINDIKGNNLLNMFTSLLN